MTRRRKFQILKLGHHFAADTAAMLVIQTNLLNETGHTSTWILPATTQLTGESLIRVFLPKGIAGNDHDCEIMIDQSRAIDNRRLKLKLKPLPALILDECKFKLRKLGEL